MAEQYTPNLGQTPAGDARRDAVHIAVAPVTAGHPLCPGERVELVEGVARIAFSRERAIGIVDPFLSAAVGEGERFWLFLYPGTVTSLRHVWTHPAFAAPVPGKEPPHV